MPAAVLGGNAIDPVAFSVVGKINPANANNSTVSTDYVDMTLYQEALFIFQLGAVDTTVDCLVRESTSTSDGGGRTLSGKSATQLGSTSDNKQVVIRVRASEVGNGYRYLRGRMSVGNGTTNIVAAIAIGFSKLLNVTDGPNLASVTQVVP